MFVIRNSKEIYYFFNGHLETVKLLLFSTYSWEQLRIFPENIFGVKIIIQKLENLTHILHSPQDNCNVITFTHYLLKILMYTTFLSLYTNEFFFNLPSFFEETQLFVQNALFYHKYRIKFY